MYNFRYAEDFKWVISFIQNLYQIHIKNESRERTIYLHNFAIFTEMLFKIMFVSFFLTCFTFILYPIYMYLIKRELVPIFPLYIPGINETTNTGFIVITIYHFMVLIGVGIGFSSFEILMAIIIINSLIFAKLISIELNHMNTDLNQGNSGMFYANWRLRNIIFMHLEMYEYVICSKKI